MRLAKHLGLLLFGILAIGLAIDYGIVRYREKRLSNAVSQSGGRMSSIKFWPIGSEYRILLNRVPTEAELTDLQQAKRMRGSVSIAFKDCVLSSDDQAMLSGRLGNCRLYVVRNGSLVPLGSEATQ